MDPARRHYYLKELGLTDWSRRGARRESAPPAVDTPQAGMAHSGTDLGANTRALTAETLPADAITGDEIANLGWEALETRLQQQDHRGASRPVFGVGARDADLMIIGEAPGAEEDRQGEPFVGRAGKLLDRMLFAIGHDRRRNTYIANICKFRPPNNRDPNADEVAADRVFLERQIELLSPKLIIAVGRVAAQTLLGSDESLGRMRGSLHRYPGAQIPVLVTYHPAYLLRSPQHKNRAWADLKRAAEVLAGAPW